MAPMQPQELAEAVLQAMLRNDAYSKSMGMEALEIGPGRAAVAMDFTDRMLNGFGIGHGGATFSLADTVLSFAANSHGRLAVALDVTISYSAKARPGDRLIARAVERSLTRRTGVYDITVTCGEKTVALFRGTVYRTDQDVLAAAEAAESP